MWSWFSGGRRPRGRALARATRRPVEEEPRRVRAEGRGEGAQRLRAEVPGEHRLPVRERIEGPRVAVSRLDAGSGSEGEERSEAERELAGFRGAVLSAEGGPVAFNAEQRLLAAFLDDGTFVFSRADRAHPAVLQARQDVERRMPIRRELGVDAAVVRGLYEAFAERQGKAVRARGAPPMQERFLSLLTEVAELGGSDIHLHVGRTEGVVRVRIDGAMRKWRDLPATEAHHLAAAAFAMADASDATYRPLEYQGARITRARTPLPPGVMSIRLQFNPLPQGGRYMVARLLYEDSRQAAGAGEGGDAIAALGYMPWHLRDLRALRRKPFGVNIICGPTGSGKSTTLQRMLSAIWRERKKRIAIETIEDPPEYVIEGAAQFPVVNALTEEERREKFRQGIVAVLRSDPDVIMIGEIRDGVSAKLCFEAAMTGHLVFASVHANDALSIVGRLLDLGVEPYKLADESLCTGLIGQRLIRVLCPHCSLDAEAARERGLVERGLAEWLAAFPAEARRGFRFANDEGCARCTEGYQGRTVLAETVVTDAVLLEALVAHRKASAREHWMQALGGVSMVEHGVVLALRGRADLNDVALMAGDPTTVPVERALQLAGRHGL